MPKKHSANFKHLQGPSSPSTNQQSNGEKKPTGVNERLSELRKLSGTDALRKKYELAESAAQPAVPPQIRGLLGLGDTAAPPPRPGVRQRLAFRGTPGPPPPRSWLQGRRVTAALSTRRDVDRSRDHRGHCHDPIRFLRMVGQAPQTLLQSRGSLLHIALRITAENFDMFDQDDLPILADLPQNVRSLLFSYLGCYGPFINISAFNALTVDVTAWSTLDLSAMLSQDGLTLAQIARAMKPAVARNVSEEAFTRLLDSWDQSDTSPAILPSVGTTSRFSALTHLSLARPPATVLWHDLLTLASRTPGLTHLSLAYWPRPTLTPNMVTTTISGRYGQAMNAGGSHLYSQLDGDNAEPVVLLRKLSASLLRLQWLDLEGCTSWVGALSHPGGATRLALGESGHTSEWQKQTMIGPFLCENWKNLVFIRLAQGWYPKIIERFTADDIERSSTWTAKFEAFVAGDVHDSTFIRLMDAPSRDAYDNEKREGQMWRTDEDQLRALREEINALRRRHACRQIEFDHGWIRRPKFT